MRSSLQAAALLLIALFSAATLASDPIWIDVRTPEEFAEGHLAGAHNIPYDQIESGIAALNLEKETPIYLYCRSGRRSGIATEALGKISYTRLTNAGGLEDAKAMSASIDNSPKK